MGEAREVAGSPFCFADGHLSSRKKKKNGVGTEVSEVQRPNCAPR